MPSLPFQKTLVNAVIFGRKPGTVRQLRKRNPITPGDKLYIFTGMRTPKCKRHGHHICVGIFDIQIDTKQRMIVIDGVPLIPIIRHWFATTDIQGTENDFFDFFEKMNYQRPLVYICWNHEVYEMLLHWLSSERDRLGMLPYVGTTKLFRA